MTIDGGQVNIYPVQVTGHLRGIHRLINRIPAPVVSPSGEQFIGVTYASYDQKLEVWKSFVQFYKPGGEFIIEKPLEGAINATRYADSWFFFSKEKNILYFLSRSIDEEFEDVFKILKYKVVLK